jgi:glycosyltransferase involved in cell wall biosynthesis
MRVCEIVPSLEERYGGPSKSVLALSRALAANDNDVALLTTHPASASQQSDGRFSQHVFRRDWPGTLCPSTDLRAHLDASACDVVHHHSIWLRTLHYAHRRARSARVPLVISPRGMMSAWAWNHHAGRKQLARSFVHPGALEAAAGWHATSTEEAAEIRALGFKQPVCVAPNGVSAPTDAERAIALAHWREACPDVARRPTAVFYSRLHRKKRVLELIELWLARAPADWLLLVVGLPEDYTPAQLETFVTRASGGGRVRIFDGTARPAPYAVASLFLLPSHNENFGLVIAEAMAHGVPALVTDATPWTSLNAAGAGWCVPWPAYGDALAAALAEGPDALAARGAVARTHVLANYSWSKSAEIVNGFYHELSARRKTA